MYNKWRETIKFFNTRIEQEVTRQEILRVIKCKPTGYPVTADNYRNLLENAGFIKHISSGKYFVLREIPDVSVTLMRRYVDKKDCLAWLEFWEKVKINNGSEKKNDKRETIGSL